VTPQRIEPHGAALRLPRCTVQLSVMVVRLNPSRS
jgi:hypothetical protein